ncbi:MAG: DUF350 domain-containing protein [Gammaproteobacteria bacterium]|nr:DUF350 domain-containing protein [Gammaproteobacteria bacterium]
MTAYQPLILNFLYALGGGLLTLAFMWLGARTFERMFSFSVAEELRKGNQAVGLVMLGVFVGVGIAIGLVVGMGLN